MSLPLHYKHDILRCRWYTSTNTHAVHMLSRYFVWRTWMCAKYPWGGVILWNIKGPHKQTCVSRGLWWCSSGQRQIGKFAYLPWGKDNIVTITTNNLEGLQPTRFLGNNMIDFYVKWDTSGDTSLYFILRIFIVELVCRLFNMHIIPHHEALALCCVGSLDIWKRNYFRKKESVFTSSTTFSLQSS
jgi:hypothetical protein